MENILNGIVFWHWFALAAVLAILDVLVGANFFFIWSGLIAFIVGVIKLLIPGLIWENQILIFSIGVLASLLIWRAYLKGKGQKSDIPNLNRRAQQYIGQVFTLQEAIINGSGKVKVGDTLWRVRGEDMPEGTKVKVIATEGVILLVEKKEG